MDQTLFDDLVQSLKEAKAISRGEMSAARRTRIDAPDVKAVRRTKRTPTLIASQQARARTKRTPTLIA